ncbi:hypothetical protein CCO03_09935 [Comamonas serinivorans]|uniref:Uncharacterized protein n=1 Tax=Comamonas serinivorans TaxID=1082851 RepID=A0A1Y0EMY8_9BURK|nr:DUF5682 family protein [Comamonas serinivorans]ARU04957.1 hypothetical protein CCO03_09935 [Comamonas serinivorans]
MSPSNGPAGNGPEPLIIGVRHHSPACARLVQARIRQLKPRHVLIEGPADFNGRVDELMLPHQLPVAIYSYLSCGTLHRGSWSPLAAHSPEWQALVEGQAAGAQVRFCDLPAWHPAFSDMENRYADVADAEQEQAGATYEAALAERLSVQGTDALWDHLFEGLTAPEQVDELSQRLAVHFAQLRGDTPGSLGNQQREQMMARWLAWAVRDALSQGWRGGADEPGGVVLVCGGFHAPMLARLWPGCDGELPDTPAPDVRQIRLAMLGMGVSASEDESDPLDTVDDEAVHGMPPGPDLPALSGVPLDLDAEPLRHGSFIVPYSFARLDAFAGYASGMASPGWYEWLWQEGPDAAAKQLLLRLSRRMRDKKLPLSTADLMAAHGRAMGLARLRGHAWPYRIDWLDAMAGALVKEALDVPLPWTYRGPLRPGTAPVLVEAMDVLAGQQLGKLAPGTPQPPLVQSVMAELEAQGLLPLQGQRRLNLLQPEDRQRSQSLHRLKLLDVPGIERTQGPDLALSGDPSEHWRLSAPVSQAAALIEAGAWGGTLRDAARAKLEHLLAGAGQDIVKLARLLNLAAWAGLSAISQQAMDRLGDAVSQAPQLEPLGEALATLHTMLRHGQALGMAHAPVLKVVVQAGFDRALWLMELPMGVPPDQMTAHIQAHATLKQIVADALADAAPALRGAQGAWPVGTSPAPAAALPAAADHALAQAAQQLAARAVAVWQRKLRDGQSDPVSRGAALGALVDLADRFDMGAVDGRAQAVAQDWEQQALALLGTLPMGGLGDALAGLLALARHALERSAGFVQGLDGLVQNLDDGDFVLALPALRGAFSWLPTRERGEFAQQVAALHGKGQGGDWRQLLARLPSEAGVLALAEAQRDERAAIARLRHWGAWDLEPMPADEAPATAGGPEPHPPDDGGAGVGATPCRSEGPLPSQARPPRGAPSIGAADQAKPGGVGATPTVGEAGA